MSTLIDIELMIAEENRQQLPQTTSSGLSNRDTTTAQIMITLRMLRQRTLSIRLWFSAQITRVLATDSIAASDRISHRIGLVQEEETIGDLLHQVQQIDRVEELKGAPEEAH